MLPEEIFYANILESIYIINTVENNLSTIKNENKIYAFNDMPIENNFEWKDINKELFKSNTIIIKEKEHKIPLLSILESISYVNKKEVNSPILSIKLQLNEKGEWVLSKECFVNFYMLKQIKFNEFYLLKLREEGDIKEILYLLMIGLIDSYYEKDKQTHIEKFKTYNLYNQIVLLKKLLSIFQKGIKLYEASNVYHIYYSMDQNITKYVKKDYIELYKSKDLHKSPLLLDYYNRNNRRNYLNFKNIKNIDPYIEKNDYQENFFQNLNIKNSSENNITITIGMAGSGKTFVNAKTIYYILWHMFALKIKGVKNTNILFTCHNEIAKEAFLNNAKKIGYESLIFHESDNCINQKILNYNVKSSNGEIENIKNKLLSIEKESKEFLDLHNYDAYYEGYANLLKIEKQLFEIHKPNNNLNLYKNTFTYIKNEWIKFKKSMNILTKFQYKLGFYNPIINLKFDAKFNKVDIRNIKTFFKTDGHLSLEKLEELILKEDKSLKDYNIAYIKLTNTIAGALKKYESLSTVIFEKQNKNFSFEKILYYLNNSYFLLPSETIAKLERKFDDNKEIILDIWPVHAVIVSKLAKYYELKPLFDFTILDEAYQTQGYLLLPLLYRSRKIHLTGDNCQIQDEAYYTTPNMSQDIISLFGNEYHLYHQRFGLQVKVSNALSFFYKDNVYKKNYLIDNFRNKKDILGLMFTITKYEVHFMTFLQSNKKELSNEMKKLLDDFSANKIFEYLNYYNDDVIIKKTITEEIETTSNLFYTDSLEKAIEFLNINGYNKDIFYLSAFRYKLEEMENKVEKIQQSYPMFKNNIRVEALQDIQGLESSVVILESFVENNQDIAFQLFKNNKEFLNTGLSRTKDIFIFIGNVKEMPFYEYNGTIFKFVEI